MSLIPVTWVQITHSKTLSGRDVLYNCQQSVNGGATAADISFGIFHCQQNDVFVDLTFGLPCLQLCVKKHRLDTSHTSPLSHQFHLGLGCVTTCWQTEIGYIINHTTFTPILPWLGCVITTHWQSQIGIGYITNHIIITPILPRLGLCHNTLTNTDWIHHKPHHYQYTSALAWAVITR